MKRLICVTGSSRGIGRSIALEFNNFYSKDTHFILFARDLNKLTEVKNQIIEESNSLNQATTVEIDFSIQHEVADYYKLLKSNIPEIHFDELIFVYNHGSLEFGSVSLAAQEPLRTKFEINLFSIWTLCSAVQLLLPTSLIKKQMHVNISSGYAMEPTANWSGQCCSRIARDMLFKCFALENLDLKVLNYEPGIVYTDMLKQACEIVEEYKDGYDNNKYTQPKDTAIKLINILNDDLFATGSRIKYTK